MKKALKKNHWRHIGILAVVTAGWVSDLWSATPEQLQQVRQAEAARIQVIDRVVPACVAVFGPKGDGGGSGVIISPDGYALTNFHVVQPSGDYMLCGLPDGKLYDTVIVGVDPTGDVALVQLLGRDDFPTVQLGDSDRVRIGDWCFTIGNPFILATDFKPSVAYGMVSGTHRYQYPAGTLLEYADCIQTDAAINPGNSGGPLFNEQGDLIGINGRGSFEKRGRVNVGVGYAISINQIKKFLGYLRSGRIVDHATLGATVATDESGTVLVSNILETSDAYRRGLRYNDEVVSLGGRPIHTANAFKNVLGIYPKGWRIPLSYRRDGIRYDVTVRLTGVHARDELIAKISGMPPGEIPRPDREDGEEKPKIPRIPKPQRKKEKPVKIPDEVQQRLIKRRGFANYFYNQLNRDRVWEAFSAHGDYSNMRGEWVIHGVDQDGDEFEFVLRDREAFATLADGPHRLDLNKGIESHLRNYVAPDGQVVYGIPPAEGALLTLAMWRRMLVEQPRQFGEVYYLGTAPMVGGNPVASGLVDVLVATYDVVENNFYFAPDTGYLVAIEAFPDSESDPFEMLFLDYAPTANTTLTSDETTAATIGNNEFVAGKLPHQFIVRSGETVLGKYRVEGIAMQTVAAEAGAATDD